MKNFLSFSDFKKEIILKLIDRAKEIKAGSKVTALKNRSLTMVFLNSSLRTRVSFERAMTLFGGHAITLNPGKDSWAMEFNEGALMNQDKPEHIKDAVRVLSRFSDVLALRSFSNLVSFKEDLEEKPIRSFAKYSTVPVVSLESALEHPCQAVADMLTIQEKVKDFKNKKFLLSYAPHIKALPMAVPISALYAGSYLGMQVEVVQPKGFELPGEILKKIEKDSGKKITVSYDQDKALKNADVIYPKSWAPYTLYGKDAELAGILKKEKAWAFSLNKIKKSATVLHCLPVRRNLEVLDEVLDSKNSAIIDEAENRLWGQVAILESLLK